MNSKNILNLIKSDKLKCLISEHRDKIKTAVLPLLIGLAVLFFWFYGSGDDEKIETKLPSHNEATAEETATESSDAQPTEGKIYVDIDGEIKKPGVYAVSDGTRLFQIIELAGGLTENASTASLNRAEAVYDGQKIIIMSSKGAGKDTDGSYGDDANALNGETVNGKVNINTADSVTLQTIPGIGPSKAARIIEYRKTSGRFKKTEDIKNVTGIGDKTYESIKEYITV